MKGPNIHVYMCFYYTFEKNRVDTNVGRVFFGFFYIKKPIVSMGETF